MNRKATGKMKLWILRPVKKFADSFDWVPTKEFPHNPWGQTYDMMHGIIVCTNSSTTARKMASAQAEKEKTQELNPWLDKHYSTCKELKPSDKDVVVMIDYHAA